MILELDWVEVAKHGNIVDLLVSKARLFPNWLRILVTSRPLQADASLLASGCHVLTSSLLAFLLCGVSGLQLLRGQFQERSALLVRVFVEIVLPVLDTRGPVTLDLCADVL
jgi:hypothetical protein